MAPISRHWRRLLAALLLGLLAQAALADPPGRVGRLADVQGQVWIFAAEPADWITAVRNQPLTTGDRLSTGADGRATLRIGSSTLRLGAGTEIEVLQLDDDIVRVQLHNGLLALRLRAHEAARETELVTAEGRFKPDRAGRYRLDRVDATSSVTVWNGQLRLEAPDNAVTLVTGQRADVWNNGRTQFALIEPRRDAFGDEVAAAELNDAQSVSAQYVSPEMTGIEDLDRNGRWENDPEYGALWVPRDVAPGWAPYRYGHWAWIRPWGWTWVDEAAWGFAPFHYGRWVYRHDAWAWSPGQWVARPVYSPALVAWVGSAPVGATIVAGPNVGWFPLAPREVFIPGYRVSPDYVRRINVGHASRIDNLTSIVNDPNAAARQANYVHRGVPGATTFVPAGGVGGRGPVAPSHVQLTDPRPGDGGRHGPAASIEAVPPANANTAPHRFPPPAAPQVAPAAQPVSPMARPSPPPATAPAATPPQRHPPPMPAQGQASPAASSAPPRHKAPVEAAPHASAPTPAVVAPVPSHTPAPAPALHEREHRDDPREKGKPEK
jgi:hypothetical protein